MVLYWSPSIVPRHPHLVVPGTVLKGSTCTENREPRLAYTVRSSRVLVPDGAWRMRDGNSTWWAQGTRHEVSRCMVVPVQCTAVYRLYHRYRKRFYRYTLTSFDFAAFPHAQRDNEAPATERCSCLRSKVRQSVHVVLLQLYGT